MMKVLRGLILTTLAAAAITGDVIPADSDVRTSSESSGGEGGLGDEVRVTNSELSEMRRLVMEQRRFIEEQGDLNTRLSAELAQQNSLIHRLENKVAKQEAELSRLDDVVLHMQESVHQLAKSQSDGTLHQLVTAHSQQHPQHGANRSHSDKPKRRDVSIRSDDAGAVQAVVDQMSQQLTMMSADIQALKNTDQLLHTANNQQDLNILDASTSTFVHWGSSHCPGDVQLVYSGVVGGSEHSQSGGGSNYLCLTLSPVFSSHAIPSYDSFLYGSEYQTYNDAHHNKDAVCAVCRPSQSTTIMIPGTNVCTPGWTKQYDGVLMAEREVHSSAEFICVDSAMESRPGSAADQNGRLLYFTVTRCGSLPCGPYVNNKIVTCVVCSR